VGSKVSQTLGCRGDDDIVGPRMMKALWTRGWSGSTTPWAWEWCRVQNVAGSGRMTVLWAREWHCGLGDGSYVVDGVTHSGQRRWQCVKGLDHGRERQRGCFEEGLTMAQRLQGGLDDDAEAPMRTR
jgi:hypothetical protein